jgi:aspartyl aminopeptidase
MSIEYRSFLDRGRTPSRAVAAAVALASGWKRIDVRGGGAVPELAPGDRVLFTDRDRSVLLAIIGKEPLGAGMRIIGAHIDTPTPRLITEDLAPDRQAVLRAYAYGGLVYRHWRDRPLTLIGRVARSGGGEVEIELGGERDDFALYAGGQPRDGELAFIVSSGDGKSVNLVAELHRRYQIDARDLQTAELYLVPRQRAREVGIDRSLIGAHGQDDRLNSYLALRALLDLRQTPTHTALVWLVDREEEGSAATGGARSRFFENCIAYLLRATRGTASEAALSRVLGATVALSADTPACLDPNWPEVHEAAHAPLIGSGPAIVPFTGGSGKRGGSQARAELLAEVIASFERAGAPLQHAQLGRVDEGGGGTIAMFLARRGIDVVDLGACVISMHSPLELSSKADAWATYRGMRSWLEQ